MNGTRRKEAEENFQQSLLQRKLVTVEGGWTVRLTHRQPQYPKRLQIPKDVAASSVDEECTFQEALSLTSGHVPRVTVPSAAVVEGQVPSEYKAVAIAVTVESVAKEVPTTLKTPVPI